MSKVTSTGIGFHAPIVYESNDFEEEELSSMKKEEDNDLMTQLPIKKTSHGNITDYELVGLEKETLDQKFQRIWLDVVKITEELNQIKKQDKLEKSSCKTLSGNELMEQANLVKQSLSQLNMFEGGINSNDINLTDPQGVVHKKLLNEIEKYKQTENKQNVNLSASSSSNGTNDQTNQIVYQLSYPIQDKKLDSQLKISDLEKRLSLLELYMGEQPLLPSQLTIDAANKSLIDVVSNLIQQSNSLNNLAEVENKAGNILKRLDLITEKKTQLDLKLKLDKIVEAYDIMTKWKGLSSLTEVADRLSTLKKLHLQALEFNQLLSHLDVTQKQITLQLKGHSELLKTVQTDFSNNLVKIKTNCQKMEAKMSSLSVK